MFSVFSVSLAVKHTDLGFGAGGGAEGEGRGGVLYIRGG